jgi:hypothetical protein
MEDIRVNVEVLGLKKRPGDIVGKNDPHYDTFKAWATNKDRKGGMILCEFIPKEKPAEESAQEEAAETEDAGEPIKCPHCDFETKSDVAMKMHIGKKHGKRG